MLGQIAMQEIERQRKMLEDASITIWENPEGPNKEYIASGLCKKILEENGFAVQMGAGGVPTAIRAVWGQGHPIIGFLGEYDALPGLSQKVQTTKEPVQEGAYGQGCGHNLLGVATLGGVIGLKKEMEENNIPGTVVFYGCPAEEVLCGKGFMARGGCFKELDAAISFHPSRFNRAMMSVYTGVNSAKFHFKGRTAHAAGDPENGRSALKAVELMNAGANYMREHITSDVRMHYTITDGGGAPNVVPANACVWYYVRALTREAVNDVYNRLVNCAKGAALMTDTEVEVEFLGGCYPTHYNQVMADVFDETLREIPHEGWTEEEIAFAKALDDQIPQAYQKACEKYGCEPGTHLLSNILPIDYENVYGSTDVGDVSYICPTEFFYTACYNVGAPGHSWQVAACAGHSIGRKGMIYASKVMATAALKMYQNPEIVKRAKEEFDRTLKGKPYICPIPDDVPNPQ